MSKFILACSCPQCDKLCLDDGFMVDFIADEGVVNLMNFSQKYWHCDDCDIDSANTIMEEMKKVFPNNTIIFANEYHNHHLNAIKLHRPHLL